MKKLMLLNVLSMIASITHSQVTNSFPAIGKPTVGASNYMSIGYKLFLQSKIQTESGGNGGMRGVVSNNLYWDSTQAKWSNGTVSSFDFAMMRFEAGGNIGFFNGPVPDPNARQTFTNAELEAYRTVTIKSNGRIGIGTASPGTNLSVYQSSSGTSYPAYPSIEINNPNTAGVSYSALILRSGAVGAGGISGAVGSLQSKSTDNASQLMWLRSYAAAYPIYIGYAQTDMTVVNGRVGIGTIDPLEKLSVKGTVLAQKVKVSQAAADWPDYVFDEDYPLMPLDSVEAFIVKNGHLPHIASAGEVLNNGIDLGDNQTKLLQKIEELTLYLIEQNKKIVDLKRELQQQKQEIQKLQLVSKIENK